MYMYICMYLCMYVCMSRELLAIETIICREKKCANPKRMAHSTANFRRKFTARRVV